MLAQQQQQQQQEQQEKWQKAFQFFLTFLAQFGPLKVRLWCTHNQNVTWRILPGGFGRGVSQLPRNPRASPAARRGNQH